MFEALRDTGFCWEVRTALFWAITQTVAVNHYRHFGATCRPRLQVLTDVSGPHLKVLTEVSGPFGPVFNSLPRFRDNLSIPSSSPYRRFGTSSQSPYRGFGTFRSRLQFLTDVSGPVDPVFKSLPRFRDNPSVPSLSQYRRFRTTCRSRLQARADVSGQPIGPFFKSLPTSWTTYLSIP